MARSTNQKDLAPIIEAFKTWIERCLITDRSLFSESLIWAPGVVVEVKAAFVDHPDEGQGNFMSKLKGQMQGASPPAKQLMAEMLWALLLFPSRIGADTKRQQVREIWALSGTQLAETESLLSDVVLGGIGSGGPGFNTHRWRELVFSSG